MWTSTTPLSTRLLLLSTLAYALFFRPLVCWTVSSAREIVSFMRLKFMLANCDMPNKWNNTTENITMYFYARYSAAIACQHTIESSEERERLVSQSFIHIIFTRTHPYERQRECEMRMSVGLLRHEYTQNGKMVKRATAPDWFLCWGVISSFSGK